MKVLARIERDLLQYGLTPERIAFRLSGRAAPRVLANSIPKAGTNLLIRALYLMYPLRRRPARTLVDADAARTRRTLERLRMGEIAAAHLEYSASLAELLSRHAILQVLMLRDPRDIAVSHYHYATYQDSKHYLHDYYTRCLNSDEERLLASIRGVPGGEHAPGGGLPALAERLRAYAHWERDPRCLIVRFEELVGAAGGGDDAAQAAVLRRIRDHLGLGLGEDALRGIAARLFSSETRTFRRGQIGAWREHWQARHFEAAERTGLPALIAHLGYPAS